VVVVTGLINPKELGRTLTHEHLSINSSAFFIEPSDSEFKPNAHKPIALDNFGWIQRHPYSHLSNLQIDSSDEETIIEELKYLKAHGGSGIVENSTVGLHPDINFIKRASVESGVKIVAATGFYVDGFQDETTRALSVEKLCERIRHDIIEGVRETGIKCGVIGEVGCTWPLSEFEKRSVQASAIMQQELGAPVIFHPGRNQEAPFETLQVFLEAGGKTDKAVMSHLDRTFLDESRLLEFANTGIYCEYDLFGIEMSDYQLCPSFDMPSDGQRIQWIKLLLDNGYDDKVLIAHDMHTKHRLMKYGGHGYSHILLNILPYMERRGITQQEIDKILIHNPRKWLTFLN
ncbi:hypothetical protein LOTGIDRAFT_103064, partial [Lottia gigantea]